MQEYEIICELATAICLHDLSAQRAPPSPRSDLELQHPHPRPARSLYHSHGAQSFEGRRSNTVLTRENIPQRLSGRARSARSSVSPPAVIAAISALAAEIGSLPGAEHTDFLHSRTTCQDRSQGRDEVHQQEEDLDGRDVEPGPQGGASATRGLAWHSQAAFHMALRWLCWPDGLLTPWLPPADPVPLPPATPSHHQAVRPSPSSSLSPPH